MIKITITVLLYFLCISFSIAQNFEWARAMACTGNSYGVDIATDAAGNIYTVGVFGGTVDFDPGPGSFNLTSRGSFSDIFIQKMDASGNFIWAKSFGSPSFREPIGRIAVDSLGFIYTTGIFAGTADFDPGPAVFKLTANGWGGFIQKLDTSGNFIWAKCYGGGQVYINDISLSPSGDIYTAGWFRNRVDFDPSNLVSYHSSVGDQDIFIHKMSSTGNFLWVRTFGSISDDRARGIAVDTLGNVYTTGWFSGTVDFDPGSNIVNQQSTGQRDIFVQKMTSAGNLLWVKGLGGSLDDFGQSIDIDAFGNVITAGVFEGTVDFDPGIGLNNLTSVILRDMFIQKLDSLGDFLWAIRFGGPQADYISSISTDSHGNIYSNGMLVNSIDFNPGTGNVILTSNGFEDVFTQKIDSSGNFVWALSYGGPSEEIASSIDIDHLGNIYTTGSFLDSVDFDPGVGVTILNAVSLEDIFVHKMSQSLPTSSFEIKNGIKISSFPNPTNGIVHISFEKAFQNVSISLSDIQGKEVFSKELNTVINEEINIEGSPGVYFLKISTNEGQSVIKLIKE
tara:strand:- start:1746 stop:3437 length:1692 start_codon:yes stop_codon:yes gene_type:complete